MRRQAGPSAWVLALLALLALPALRPAAAEEPAARPIERVGFRASGRNRGWLSGKPVGDRRPLALGPAGAAVPVDLRRARAAPAPPSARLMDRHGIDIQSAHRGYLLGDLHTLGFGLVDGVLRLEALLA